MIGQIWYKCISKRFFHHNTTGRILDVLIGDHRIRIISLQKCQIFVADSIFRRVRNNMSIHYFAGFVLIFHADLIAHRVISCQLIFAKIFIAIGVTIICTNKTSKFLLLIFDNACGEMPSFSQIPTYP